MRGQCEICSTEIEIELCCNGYMCGCMGLPTSPPVCSKECYDKLMKRIYKPKYQIGQIVDYKGEWYIINSIIEEGGGIYKEDEGLKNIFNGENYHWVDDSLIQPIIYQR